MAADDLILAPENLQVLLQGLDGLYNTFEGYRDDDDSRRKLVRRHSPTPLF